MKRLILAIALLLAAVAAGAQERPKFTAKVIEIHNRDPHMIADAVKMLGSGMSNSGLSVNQEMRTITVRDYPENVAAIEQAIARLDRPSENARSMELRVSVLLASKGALDTNVPDDLAPVVKQLQSTLRYSHYALLATSLHRAKAGSNLEGSGFIERPLFDSGAKSPTPYSYRMRNISVTSGDRPSIDIDPFGFSIMPIGLRPVGFETRVSIHPDEKVVIGTTTVGDRALIVVLSAKLE